MAPRLLGVAAGGLIVVTNLRTILLALEVTGTPFNVLMISVFGAWVALVAYVIRKERAVRRAEREATLVGATA
jgi:hypothetical protein